MITAKPPSQVAVSQGATLSLCCEATGSPPPKVQWSRAAQSSASTMVFQEAGCLKFNIVKYDNDGDYTCQATNNYGIAEATTTVIVPRGCAFHISYDQLIGPFYVKRNNKAKTQLRAASGAGLFAQSE